MSIRHEEHRMKTHPIHRSHSMQILYLGAMAWACAPAMAQGDAAATDAASLNQRERAACFGKQSTQDLSSCLREAAAAQAQRRKGVVTDDAAALERNALQRCDALPGDDRKACVARIQGQGNISGSVAGGGILRELVITEPAASGTH
jgi:hypothetical protein